jgi:hypothetical protein
VDKHPVRSKKGYADIRKTYDEYNNVKEEAYFDENDHPWRSVDGYARVIRDFDRNRNIIDERYFDGQGKPLSRQKGLSLSLLKKLFDLGIGLPMKIALTVFD